MSASDSTTLDQGNTPIRLAILGATGSIGMQALSVCRAQSERVRVVALSAYDNVATLVDLARSCGATAIAVGNEARAHDHALADLPDGVACAFGEGALRELCERDDVDAVLNAVVGAVGIVVGHAALRSGKRLLCANKESIVVGGDLLIPLAAPGQLIPVDSEHSAIHQCLAGERHADVRRLWLTCSGGPFFGRTREGLANVTPDEALAHPTWNMGAKITVDSATLMNKGLEVLEAAQLFGMDVDDISVLIHRQSRVHSMVEFVDGSIKAQLGPSDMRIPIQYALSWPRHWEAPCAPIDLALEEPLTFDVPDERAFGCLALAREAGRTGGTLPCAMNAANEVANAAFRLGACGFLDIEGVVRAVMDATEVERVETLCQLSDVDRRARERARALIGGIPQL